MKLKQLAVVGLIASTLALSGCGAMSTAVKKRNLDVKTQMSETIWLEPSSEKTVYLQIRNTSDKDMSGLQAQITNELAAKGYRVSSSPDTAYYWIQANVLKAEKWICVMRRASSRPGMKVRQWVRHWARVLRRITRRQLAQRWVSVWPPG
jgi:hypothetical protein